MDNDFCEEQQVPSAVLTGVAFNVLSHIEVEKIASISIESVGEVSDSRLGLPNSSNQCSTCGAKDLKQCEGHFGSIKLPCTILHPYFLSEVAMLLNKICPGCKSVRQDVRVKKSSPNQVHHGTRGCKYCLPTQIDWYPPMKFKVSSKDHFRRTAIIVEIDDSFRRNVQKKLNRKTWPTDYWDFIPKDLEQDESCQRQDKRVLSHAQVYHLLNGVDPTFIRKFISRKDSLFLNCFPVTPNGHRVTEVTHAFSHGRLVLDDRTRVYKKLVDFRGTANELGSRVLECLKVSKLNPDKLSSTESAFAQNRKSRDLDFTSSGLRWMKDVVLGKRSDYCFRMVVTGNPNIKLSEIGVPCHIAERLQVSETLNKWNCEKLNAVCSLLLLEKGGMHVRRKGCLVRVSRMKELLFGDTIYRPLTDGDMVLINRPPSIHQHSLLALNAKVLPIASALSINPLCCSPLRGDFDGDCIHGYIPQSVDARVELNELVGVDRQLYNGQSGRNLLSLGQDSLIAAHLILEGSVCLNRFSIQQLKMLCPNELPPPAIVKVPSVEGGIWTGKQLFQMLLPTGLEWFSSSNDIGIRNGEIVFSEGSGWLRDTDDNLFQRLITFSQSRVLNVLHDAQEVLCEWLSTRGLSVSLSDLYLASDSFSRENMIEEISCGLQEADEACNIKQFMVDSSRDFLAGNGAEISAMAFGSERLCYEKQKSAALSQASVDAFKRVFRDIQSLAYKYANKDNSMISMFKAGSKGNLLKIAQHSMCVGLQHSLVPLSFDIPHQLSCSSYNNHKEKNIDHLRDSPCPRSFIPFAVVKNSFLSGLNPLECFIHSVTNRASSFSENAEVPGTLHRKLMFFMRDLYVSYDGTVRSAYGNQLIEFYYGIEKQSSTPCSSKDSLSCENAKSGEGMGGQPVGSMSACAISEAAYSALDQPISLLETSPLLNLKNVLESGTKKSNSCQTMSLFLSKQLAKHRHGLEYGALAVKDYLERLFFSDIVSTTMIIFSPENYNQNLGPWVCHFHIRKDIITRRELKLHSIIGSLQRRCHTFLKETRVDIPPLQITINDCSLAGEEREDAANIYCITLNMVEESKKVATQPTLLRKLQELVIPCLLGTVIKGFMEVKKVDILWSESSKLSKSNPMSTGELYLRVSMSAHSEKMKLWSALMNNCVPIMDAIDWSRSHPDTIREFSLANGIDAGWKYFLNSLGSAVSDTGKTVLPEHLVLVANCLSTSGEFVGLNPKGMSRQRETSSVSSPFVQACFSNPGPCFIKAAKAGTVDNLQGSLDALAWGKVPSLGTGGLFEIIYSGKGHELAKPESVYNLLRNKVSSTRQNLKLEMPNAGSHMSDRCGAEFVQADSVAKVLKKLEINKSLLRKFITFNDIQKLSLELKKILYKYPINHHLGEQEKSIVMMALKFHPRGKEKIGTGARDIKVGHHPKHQDSRCFMLVRADGTAEDFSYHKCVLGALEIIAPERAKTYQSKWLTHEAEQV
ncbi:DNA-directed RNA polymerase [Psidium guajava]|nr:DNA-directed RNA polymerase [Psidium guajava]